MSKKTKKPTAPETAIVKAAPAQLDQVQVLDGQLVPHVGTEPFQAFQEACDESSCQTMVARLHAVARILRPSQSDDEHERAAEIYPWETLDHIRVQHVLAVLGRSHWDDEGWSKRKRMQAASPSTRNLTRAAMRKMAKVLFTMNLVDVAERQRIDDVKPARGKRLARGRALTARELRKLFAVCAKDESAAGRRDAALLGVLFGAGLRRAEASQLDVTDVRDGHVNVIGKGDDEADQPIAAEVAAALSAWIEVRGEREAVVDEHGEQRHPLFVTINKYARVGERRLDGKAIAWAITKRAVEAGIERLPADHAGRRHLLSPHDLRRSYVTSLLDLGEDLSTVSKAARHASISTTAIYDRRDAQKVVEAIGKLRVPFGR